MVPLARAPAAWGSPPVITIRSEGVKLMRSLIRRRGTRAAAMIAATAAFAGVMSGYGASTATADPIMDSKTLLANPVSADGSKITKAEYKDDRSIRLQVYSAAMDRTFPVDVQRPADASVPRPVLYLL